MEAIHLDTTDPSAKALVLLLFIAINIRNPGNSLAIETLPQLNVPWRKALNSNGKFRLKCESSERLQHPSLPLPFPIPLSQFHCRRLWSYSQPVSNGCWQLFENFLRVISSTLELLAPVRPALQPLKNRGGQFSANRTGHWILLWPGSNVLLCLTSVLVSLSSTT